MLYRLDPGAKAHPELFAQLDADEIKDIACNRAGDRIACVTTHGACLLWDARTRRMIKRWPGVGDELDCVRFQPNGALIAAASSYNEVRLFDTANLRELPPLDLKDSPVQTVAFDAQGDTLLTGSVDGRVRLWSVRNRKLQATLDALGGWIESAVFSPDDALIAAGGSLNSFRLWDRRSLQPLPPLPVGGPEILSLAFLDGGATLAVGGDQQPLRIWRLDRSAPTENIETGSPTVEEAVTADTASRLLATALSNGDVAVWDAQKRTRIALFPAHQGRAASVCLAPSRSLVASVGLDGNPKVYSYAVKRLVAEPMLPGEAARPRGIRFDPQGNLLACGDADGAITVWDTQRWHVARSWRAHQGAVNRIEFSPDGREILSCGNDGRARIWDATTGAARAELLGHRTSVLTAAYDHQGSHIVTGDMGGTLRLYSRAGGLPLQTVAAHNAYLRCAVFSPDDRLLCTAGRDGRIRFWQTADLAAVAALILDGRGEWVLNSPDNYYMASRKVVPAVAFRLGDRAYPFEQFDLTRNRPDLVLPRLGRAPEPLVAAYGAAYRKRLAVMGPGEPPKGDDFDVPQVTLIGTRPPVTTATSTVSFRVRAQDRQHPVIRLNVSVNHVPIYGAKGLALSAGAAVPVEREIRLDLCVGPNSVQVSALNSQGVESLQTTFQIAYTPSAPQMKPDIYVVAIGVSTYQDKNHSLQYADRDADALLAFLQQHHDHYATVHPLVLNNERANKADIVRRTRELLAHTHIDDEVILFLAGHGVLDAKLDYYFAPYDIDFQQPAGHGLSYAELEGLLDGIAARKKLLLMDTCHAGEVDREAVALVPLPDGVRAIQGIREAPTGLAFAPKLGLANSFALMQELFTDLRHGSGAVVIASAGGTQFAYERSGHGVFTQALLEGLEQGKTKVSELRETVQSRVRELTNEQQTPTARREEQEFDFDVY